MSDKKDDKSAMKPIVEKRLVKHTFTPEELLDLSDRLCNALAAEQNVNAEFDAVKQTFKGRISAAESDVMTLSSTLRARFEMRQKECEIRFRLADKKKDVVCVETGELIATEDMTDNDLQMELIQAESAFERREEIVLFEAGPDRGILAVGKQKDRWFTALRMRIGDKQIEQRLDSEQKSTKKRWDAVNSAATSALKWINDTVGTKEAEGFEEGIEKAIEPHKERVE